MRYFLLKVSIIIVLCGTNGYANDSLKLALEYHQSGQFNRALPMLIELARAYQKKNDLANYALCQIKLADEVRMYGGPNLAIEMLNRNQDLLNVRLENSSLLSAQNHLAKAEAHYSALQLTEFKQEILKSLNIKRRAGVPEVFLAEDYLHLARYYKDMPNRNDSCYYYVQKSLRLAKSNKPNNLYLLPRIYNLLGYYFHPASIAYFIGKRDSMYRHFKLSRLYYDSALWFINQQKRKDIVMLNRVYHNLGNSYNNEYSDTEDKPTMDKAMHFYTVSLKHFKNFGAPADLALRHWVIATGFDKLHQYDSALFQINKGLNLLMPDYAIDRPSKTPPLKSTFNDRRFITLLTKKALILQQLALNTGNPNALLSAYENWVYLLKFNKYLISKSNNEQEALHWTYLYGSNAYQFLMSLIYELNIKSVNNDYLKKTFGLVASGKYAYLNRTDISPEVNTLIKSEFLFKEYDLVINNIESTIGLTRSTIKSFLPVLPEQQRPSDQSVQIDNSLDDDVSIDFLQREVLDSKSAYLDFYVLDKDIFSVIILNDTVKLIKHKVGAQYAEYIRQLNRKMLYSKPQQYAKIAYLIYQDILEPFLKQVPDKINKLIICPDGQLQNIAWDALVSDTLNTESFKGLNYLLKRYAISTALSPIHLKRPEGKPDKTFIGISPDFSHSKHLSEIPFSRGLVNRKAEKYNGSHLSSFSTNKLSATIIHIATHIKTDALHPFNSVMYLDEGDSITMESLTGLPLKPRLAILNGCSSGIGTSLYTEGSLSFARAFYRLGAESVLMTLWDVDDKTAANVLEHFYEQMNDGNDLSLSLRNAKLDYLFSQQTDDTANPYYWAGLQLSGKTTALFKPSTRYWYLLLVCLFIAAGVYYYRLKKFKE
jgi:CHAT domain-containing protein